MSGGDDREVAYTLWTTRDIGSAAMAERFLDVLRAVGHHWLPNSQLPLVHDLELTRSTR